jgi:hypothetical protein
MFSEFIVKKAVASAKKILIVKMIMQRVKTRPLIDKLNGIDLYLKQE